MKLSLSLATFRQQKSLFTFNFYQHHVQTSSHNGLW